jgi:aspartate aminotransferase
VIRLADRVQRVSPSMTFAVSAKAKVLKAQGIDICDFSVGEPDFVTPSFMREAAKAALDAGMTKYAPTAGLPELRARIALKLKEENALPYASEQVLVANGVKEALYNVLFATLNRGDEVLIPTPAWVTYPEVVKLTGAEPVYLKTGLATQFKITPAQLNAAVTDRTRMLILNSPSNPTGAVYSREELAALAEVIVAHQIVVIADEIYEKLIYGDMRHVSIGSLGDDIFNLTVTFNGFSKAYAATGWRLGYAAGPLTVIKAATTIQSHSTSGANTFAQYGALAALSDQDQSRATIAEMRSKFQQRRDLVLTALRQMPQLTCNEPQGAFYVFPDISATGLDSLTFCDQLLERAHIAAVPGVAFEADAHIRLSYATDSDTLRQGLANLHQFLSEHPGKH